ncbi:hypothetical protein QN277_012700 [Acacia crassicarpa]|uniref:Transposase n=1 Tax=Acacia crassicarpa TaxID=499986 RepID=A0AAE1N2F4_9FABA|nr:hypothetical protein QN277_012700 [Acacia crassicarpa]
MSSKGKEKMVDQEGSESTVKGKGESSRQDEAVNEEYIVPSNVEGFIELTEPADDYDEIEFLGEEYNVPEEEEDSDVNVLSSDDDSYRGQRESSGSYFKESLYEDSEVGEFHVDDESDADGDEEDSDVDVPLQQLCVLPEAEPSGRIPSFVIGMTFEDKNELKRAIDEYAISRGVKLRIVRSDRKTFRVVCEDGCSFTLYASTHGQSVGWQVKSLDNEHMCARAFEYPRASTKWLAGYFKNKVQEDPKFKSKEMKKEVQWDLKVNVSVHKCKRAKRMIMEEMEGGFRDEFANLEAYCNELKLSNPSSDVCVEVSEEGLEHGRRIFKRMYVCFNASKVGWREGCRPLICVDGTFLKGRFRGILLTEVGVDGNDSLYPLAVALVEKENTHHWNWFLQWLQQSLHLGSGDNVTLMSDMQKGLANAVSDVLPEAEHRFCARHIYANWSKKWRGNEFKKKFFSCAWSTYVEDFKDNLTRLGNLKKEAATDAVSYPIQCWVRAYFSSRCSSWMVDNNMSESFNAWIDEYRCLPVIRMFEGIRLKMMGKWAESERNVRG